MLVFRDLHTFISIYVHDFCNKLYSCNDFVDHFQAVYFSYGINRFNVGLHCFNFCLSHWRDNDYNSESTDV